MTAARPHLIRQVLIFCGVGGLNTLLSLGIILSLSEIFHVHYVLANTVGYAMGLLSGYLLHKKITFKTQDGNAAPLQQFFIFLIVFAIGYTVQLGALMMLVETVHVPNILAQIIAWVVYVSISFAGHKFFTFHGDSHE